MAESEHPRTRMRARLSVRFVIGLGVSLVLHALLLGLLLLRTGPFGAPSTAPASSLLIEWRETVAVPPSVPPPPAANVATPAVEPSAPLATTDVRDETAQSQAASGTVAEASPPVAATTVASSAPTTAPPGVAETYLWDVLAHLRRFQRYPERARRDGIEGTVWLRARVSRRGEVLRAEVERSSGHDPLDAAATRLIARASPLPPPPESRFAITDLHVPVEYRLQRE